MRLPGAAAYMEALQDPGDCFSDPELAGATAALGPLGLPRAVSGNVAVVFRLDGDCGRSWAVRCFVRPLEAERVRYEALRSHLGGLDSPWRVGFDLQPLGIRVDGEWWPVVKMEWAAGEPLLAYVHRHLWDGATLGYLAARVASLAERLRTDGVAHGDLQHGNILVAPGGDLRLVDYDGMYVPALAGWTGTERGHRNYQHPGRAVGDFGPHLDSFSAWSIYASIAALAADPLLWGRLDGGEEALLLRHHDLAQPERSAGLAAMEASQAPGVAALAHMLRSFLAGPPHEVPPLSLALAPSTAPLSPRTRSGSAPSGVAGLGGADRSWTTPRPAAAGGVAAARAEDERRRSLYQALKGAGSNPVGDGHALPSSADPGGDAPASAADGAGAGALPRGAAGVGGDFAGALPREAAGFGGDLAGALPREAAGFGGDLAGALPRGAAGFGGDLAGARRTVAGFGSGALLALLSVLVGMPVLVALAGSAAVTAVGSARVRRLFLLTPEARVAHEVGAVLAGPRRAAGDAVAVVERLTRTRAEVSTREDEAARDADGARMGLRAREDAELREVDAALEAVLTSLAERARSIGQAEKQARVAALADLQASVMNAQLAQHNLVMSSTAGVSEKIVQRLARYGVRTAADFTDVVVEKKGGGGGVVVRSDGRRLQVDGVDQAQAVALLRWRRRVAGGAQLKVPEALPPERLAAIRAEHDRRRSSVAAEGEGARADARRRADEVRTRWAGEYDAVDQRRKQVEADAARERVELDRDLARARKVVAEAEWHLDRQHEDAGAPGAPRLADYLRQVVAVGPLAGLGPHPGGTHRRSSRERSPSSRL